MGPSSPPYAVAVRRFPRDRALTYLVLTALLTVMVAWNVQKARDMVTLLDFGDFGIFHRAAARHLAGEDMYPVERHTIGVGGRTVTFERPNLNPPHFHLLLLPFARLPVGVALVIWSVASVASLLVCLRFIMRESELTLSPLVAMRGAAWLGAFAGTAAVISTTQLSLLLLLPVTLAWVAARRGAWTLAGVWLGVALSLKPFLVIFLPYLLLRRRLAAASTCLTTLACFGLGLVVFGVQSHHEWLALLAGVDWTPTAMNASLLGLLSRSLGENRFVTPIMMAPELVKPLWGVLVGLVGLVTLRIVVDDEADSSVDRNFALLLVAALLISPLGWLYYLWLPLGPVVALASRWWGAKSPRSAERPAPARWRDRLLWLAAPGFFLPTTVTLAFQPSPWATLVLGSLHSWAVLLLWTALVIDAIGATPGAPRDDVTSAGSATGLREAR